MLVTSTHAAIRGRTQNTAQVDCNAALKRGSANIVAMFRTEPLGVVNANEVSAYLLAQSIRSNRRYDRRQV